MYLKLLFLVQAMTLVFFVRISCHDPVCQDPGWFGETCQYKCHCQNNTLCNKTNGACLGNSRCISGWFGPACQYVDLAFNESVLDASSNSVANITDNDEKTCYWGASNTMRIIFWNYSHTFTWARFHFKPTEPWQTQNLTIQFRADGSEESRELNCDKREQALVSTNTLDVHCDLRESVKEMILEGQAIESLCSVYISGGRNVALKQNATQSSDYGNFTADKAVDGRREYISEKENFKDCTHTGEPDPAPSWALTFARPQRVNKFVLYNRGNPHHYHRLKGFTLTGFDERNEEVFRHVDNETKGLSQYTIYPVHTEKPIYRVQINATNVIDPSSKVGKRELILTLCEVEIYGDSDCGVGFYGRECEKKCNCHGQACFVSTGGCPGVCAAGHGGESCHEDSGKDEWMSSLSGGIIGAALLILVGLGCLIIWRWRKVKSKRDVASRRGTEGELDEDTDNRRKRIAEEETAERNEPALPFCKAGPSSADNYKGCSSDQGKTAIAVKDLGQFLHRCRPEYFRDQFQSVPGICNGTTMDAGTSAVNKTKNRYKNICTYDHSRVHLLSNPEKHEGDYINASYIEGYKKEEIFIASQGPNRTMLVDFVRMLWERKPDKVVMLTNLVEEGKAKCERYWPEVDADRFGDIAMELGTTYVFADYTIRQLTLMKKDEPAHSLTQFHFTSWPDKDVPDSPWPLVDFEQRVATQPTTKPIVVHCSAGIGRTGTFIALRNVMREAEDTGTVDFYSTLVNLRKDRMNMIQTLEQYIFLHKAAHVAMVCLGTTVSASNIARRLDLLKTITPTGQTNMKREYEAVSAVCAEEEELALGDDGDDDNENIYQNNQLATNRLKNRVNNILPKEDYRPHLMHNHKTAGDYINAVLVPSFARPAGQILTQLPLPTTIIDFWRLVIQYKVSLVVAFELDCMTSDSTIGTYLPPSEREPVSFGSFIIQTGPTTSTNLWDEQQLVITAGKRKKKALALTSLSKTEELKVTHIKCKSTNFDPEAWLNVLRIIRSLRPSMDKKTLFTCRNGADYSGLACVLSLLLDRLDNDHCLTVPLVVGTLKAIRPQVIPTLEQYKLLYETLKCYTESAGVYSNVGDVRSKPSRQTRI